MKSVNYVKDAVQLTFSKNYMKLRDPEFHTVRWLDKRYTLGKDYPVVFVVPDNPFHQRLDKRKARVIKLEIKRIKDLSDEFILKDAECNRKEFINMMREWYGEKVNWQEQYSEVQIVWCKYVFD